MMISLFAVLIFEIFIVVCTAIAFFVAYILINVLGFFIDLFEEIIDRFIGWINIKKKVDDN